MNFELSVRLAESQLVVAFRGQLDAVDAARAVTAVTGLRTSGQCAILDLAALDFLDCFSLRALAVMRDQAREAGGDVLLAAPREPVQRLLTVTGLGAWFCVHATVADAVASTEGRFAGQSESA